jgi:hypothetical protein
MRRGRPRARSADTSIVLDPIVTAAGVGLIVSPLAGRAFLHGQERLPERWRRTATWLLVGAAVAATAVGELSPDGRLKEAAFVVLLGVVPGVLAFAIWRTWLASTIVCLVPLYFGVGAQTLDGRCTCPSSRWITRWSCNPPG